MSEGRGGVGGDGSRDGGRFVTVGALVAIEGLLP